jgi:hypothetical protein
VNGDEPPVTTKVIRPLLVPQCAGITVVGETIVGVEVVPEIPSMIVREQQPLGVTAVNVTEVIFFD